MHNSCDRVYRFLTLCITLCPESMMPGVQLWAEAVHETPAGGVKVITWPITCMHIYIGM